MDELVKSRIRELVNHGMGDSSVLLPLLNALVSLHVDAEIRSPASLPLFRELLPHALYLLDHPNEYVRTRAVDLIGAMQLEAPIVVPRLVETLRGSHGEPSREEIRRIVQAIAAYGADAAAAISPVVEILASTRDHNTISTCARAMVGLGATAEEWVQALEAARDRVTLKLKSDDRSFKSDINRQIKALNRASKPTKSLPPRNEHQSYLLDLLERLGKKDESLGYSRATTSYKARDEASSLCDPELIIELQALLRQKLSVGRRADAMTILGYLTANTNSELGREIIVQTLRQNKVSDLVLQTAIYAASRAKVREAIPDIGRLLRAGNSIALTFAEELRAEECIPDIASLMEKGGDSCTLAIFALQQIGSPKAIPHLLELASREFTSRKQSEREWRFYSIIALGSIGDTSIVPHLVELLKRFKGWDLPILKALCDLSNPRAYNAVVEVLDRIVGAGIPRDAQQSWSPGHRTDVVNAVEFFKKVGLHTRADVVRLTSRISDQTLWARLLPEEQAYLCSLGVGFDISKVQQV